MANVPPDLADFYAEPVLYVFKCFYLGIAGGKGIKLTGLDKLEVGISVCTHLVKIKAFKLDFGIDTQSPDLVKQLEP
jgi:hypothetical protein